MDTHDLKDMKDFSEKHLSAHAYAHMALPENRFRSFRCVRTPSFGLPNDVPRGAETEGVLQAAEIRTDIRPSACGGHTPAGSMTTKPDLSDASTRVRKGVA
jgi:hypothetical protein